MKSSIYDRVIDVIRWHFGAFGASVRLESGGHHCVVYDAAKSSMIVIFPFHCYYFGDVGLVVRYLSITQSMGQETRRKEEEHVATTIERTSERRCCCSCHHVRVALPGRFTSWNYLVPDEEFDIDETKLDFTSISWHQVDSLTLGPSFGHLVIAKAQSWGHFEVVKSSGNSIMSFFFYITFLINIIQCFISAGCQLTRLPALTRCSLFIPR